MSKIFDPKDWYWFVAGDATKVYSSKIGDYVLVSDANYITWGGDGTIPSNIDTETNLGQVLAPYFLRPSVNAALQSYLDTQMSGVDKVQFKILFFLLNEVRVLKGQQPITVPQAMAAFRNLI